MRVRGGGRGGFDWCNNGAPATSGERGAARRRGGAARQSRSTRSGLYRSDDGGRQWTLVSNCDERPLYFSQVSVDPQNPNTVYVAGSPAVEVTDGGKTFTALVAPAETASRGTSTSTPSGSIRRTPIT